MRGREEIPLSAARAGHRFVRTLGAVRVRVSPRPVAIAIVVLASLGCGVRTYPLPPEDTAARAPEPFAAKAHAGEVVISWGRPTKAIDGSRLYDLAKFVVERRSGEAPFGTIATVDVSDQDRIRPQKSFHVRDAPVPPGTFEYRVRAVAEDGELGVATEAIRVEVPAPGTETEP